MAKARSRQPNEKTWASQSRLWTELVLAYCRFHRVFRLELGDAAIAASELWSNRSLDRACGDARRAADRSPGRVSPQLQREIVDLLVKAGGAAYDPPPSRSAPHPPACFVYWRRPDEWGEIMYADVVARGETNSIMTLFELQQGDATPADAEYRDMPTALLRTCLATLAKSGRAQVFRGTEGDGDGVKFV